MRNHITRVATIGMSYRGKCTCRLEGPLVTLHWQAEDWGRRHIAEIEHTRARLASREMTLTAALKLYRLNSHDENLPPQARALWTQMADEIEHRLGLDHPLSQMQLPLFEEPAHVATQRRRTTRQASYGS